MIRCAILQTACQISCGRRECARSGLLAVAFGRPVEPVRPVEQRTTIARLARLGGGSTNVAQEKQLALRRMVPSLPRQLRDLRGIQGADVTRGYENDQFGLPPLVTGAPEERAQDWEVAQDRHQSLVGGDTAVQQA